MGSKGNCLATEAQSLPKGALPLVLLGWKRVIRAQMERGATFSSAWLSVLYSLMSDGLKFEHYFPNPKELQEKIKPGCIYLTGCYIYDEQSIICNNKGHAYHII